MSRAAASVSTCFDAGWRRQREPELPYTGEAVVAADGLWARFSLSLGDGVIEQARFRAASCVTLVAYCELLCRMITGERVATAETLSPQVLVDQLPGVPPVKQDRAVLAVAALRGAAFLYKGQQACHSMEEGS